MFVCSSKCLVNIATEHRLSQVVAKNLSIVVVVVLVLVLVLVVVVIVAYLLSQDGDKLEEVNLETGIARLIQVLLHDNTRSTI